MAHRAAYRVGLYIGPGTTPRTRNHCWHFVLDSLSDQTELIPVHAADILAGGWQQQLDLIIIPGGATTPCHQALGEAGLQHIRDFVHAGGRYLGWCAGGYFGCQNIEFAKGNPEFERITTGELGFFPGTAVGPVYPGFDYTHNTGVYAAPIATAWGTFPAYFNGGQYFQNAADYPQVQILATYPEHHNHAAIVLCAYGQGRALLSGVHLEYNPHIMYPEDARRSQVAGELIPHDATRRAYAKFLLTLLLGECPTTGQTVPNSDQ